MAQKYTNIVVPMSLFHLKNNCENLFFSFVAVSGLIGIRIEVQQKQICLQLVTAKNVILVFMALILSVKARVFVT